MNREEIEKILFGWGVESYLTESEWEGLLSDLIVSVGDDHEPHGWICGKDRGGFICDEPNLIYPDEYPHPCKECGTMPLNHYARFFIRE